MRPVSLPRRALLLVVFVCAAGALCDALDWPVAIRSISGTFGEDRGDHFHNGIDIGGGGQEVHPVLPGEVVFRYDEASDYSSLPRGLGTFVVLRHSLDVLSAYCHLVSGSLGPAKETYQLADRIGILGETGHAQGPHLHFSLYDEEAGSMVNPLTLLPPIPDRQAPLIRRVILVAGDQRTLLADGADLAAETVDVLAEVYDLREDVRFSWPLAPYSISVSLDGNEVARIVFDSLSVQDGRLLMGASGPSRDALYDPSGLVRCGTLKLAGGVARLRLSARDFAGNEAVKEIAFTVRE